MNKLVLDVGAANGVFARHILENTKNIEVFIIEPNSFLNGISLERIVKEFPHNSKYFEIAVGSQNTEMPLYGYKIHNGQVGSLKQINQQNINKILKSNFNVSNLNENIMVKVKSVATFIQENQISQIDFLKIDTQGNDLDLLELFLKEVTVKCMVVEVTGNDSAESNLYLNSNNLISRVFKMAEAHSLNILKVVPNNDLSEFNIFLAPDIAEGEKILYDLQIEKSETFGRYWKVLGIGETLNYNKNKNRHFLKKIAKGVTHPSKSIKSVLIKLTR
jgi:FkbM family methyltransferase